MALWRPKLNIRHETWHPHPYRAHGCCRRGGASAHRGWGSYLIDPWKRALWIGLTIFWIGLLLYVRIVKPLFMLRRPYRVSEVREERGDTSTLVMHSDGHPGFRFSPGQLGWLTLWGSPFKITEHPFSFSSNAEAAGGRVEMSIRNLGDFTSAIDKAPVGRRVYLDGPYGAFTIGNPADMHVLIAGCVGITPMMSMIRTLADQGDVGARECARGRPPGSVPSMRRPRSMQLFITRPDSVDPLPRAARVPSRLHPRDVRPRCLAHSQHLGRAAKGVEG